MEEIDIVIPWVNDRDKSWIQERNRFLNHFEDRIDTIDKYYRDWGTLLFVFRGIEKFMPWVRKVHFLTYGHVPEWMDTKAVKLNIVKHEEFYLNTNHLPIFNSQSIEMNFLGIKDLANKFIYFNDDTLVLKETPVERFFANGLPLDFIIQDIPRQGIIYRMLISNDSYVDTMGNNLRLINRVFDKKKLLAEKSDCFYSKSYTWKSRLKNYLFNFFPEYLWFSNYHFQQAFLKANIEDAYALFKDEMDLTSASRFRGQNDLNQYIYRYIRLAKGEFVPYEPDDSFCLVLDSYKSWIRNKGKIYNCRFFCPNDSPNVTEQDYIQIKSELMEMLTSVLVNKSTFEK